jgi:hypothetical protein
MLALIHRQATVCYCISQSWRKWQVSDENRPSSGQSFKQPHSRIHKPGYTATLQDTQARIHSHTPRYTATLHDTQPHSRIHSHTPGYTATLHDTQPHSRIHSHTPGYTSPDLQTLQHYAYSSTKHVCLISRLLHPLIFHHSQVKWEPVPRYVPSLSLSL